MKTLIKNGTIVNASGRTRSDLLIVEDRIAAIGELPVPEDAEVLDARGCYLLPGFIDTHTHFDLDTGVTVTADDFHTGSRAAVLGGTTCVLDFATQDPGGTLQAALDAWRKKAAGANCNYGFHMAIADWNAQTAAELESMLAQGVTSFKMYMVYNGLRVDDGALYDALKAVKACGALMGVHCENWDVLQRRIAELKAAGVTSPSGHPLSRPAEVEAEGVARLMRIAQLADAPCYVVHLSTAEGLNEVRRARERGQKVLLETCPQYLLLDEARYGDLDGAKYVMSPPLRREADRQALWAALQSGEIDFVGTDHCSYTMAQKAIGKDDFSRTPNGIPGVQHRGQLLYTYGVCEGRLTLEQMAALLSKNAADVFGMPDRGELAAGKAADVVVWDPVTEGCITDANHAHHCDNSPFASLAVRGGAREVFVNGEKVVSGGAFIKEGAGKYIRRDAAIWH